jgi:hypothetical protein
MHIQARGRMLVRLVEQMRDRHGRHVSFQSNTWAAILIPVDEDDTGVF